MKTIRFGRYTDDMLDDMACSIASIKNIIEVLSRTQENLFDDLIELGLRLDKLESKRKVK